MIRHPVPFFVLAPMLTWWLKMRLPFELRPERKAAYRFSDKLVNTLVMYARYKLARHLAAGAMGGRGMLPIVLLGDYLAMFFGVLLFHWQVSMQQAVSSNEQAANSQRAAVRSQRVAVSSQRRSSEQPASSLSYSS